MARSKVKRQVASDMGKKLKTVGPAAEGVAVAQSADSRLGETKIFDQERSEELEALRRIQEKVNEQYNVYISKLAEEGSDTIKIGDLVFSQAREVPPPTAIRVDKQFLNHKWQALRTEQAKKAPSGHANARVSLTVLFVGLKDINDGLRRLIATFKAVPFVPIENSFLRSNLNPNSLDVMAFSLVSMSVRTMPQMPTTLAVDLDLLYFNYKPYAPNFWLRRGWDSVLSEKAEHVQRIAAKSLTTYPLITQAEQTKAKSAAEGGEASPTKRDPTIAYTTPTIDPNESRPWQLLVNRQMGETIQTLTNDIKIKYRLYKAVDTLLPDRGSIPLASGRLRTVDTTNIRVYKNVVMKMTPEAASELEALAARFQKKWGKRLPVSSCFRTREHQQNLYQREQYANNAKVIAWKKEHPGQKPPPDLISQADRTVAKNSWHETGLAVDIPTVPLSNEEWVWLVGEGSGGFSCLGKRGKRANARKGQWETWHFDYIEGQREARQKHNNNTQQAIAYLRSHLYYADEVDENGDKLTEEKLEAKDREYVAKLEESMRKLTGEGWTLDQNASTGSKLIFYQDKQFIVQDQDMELIPQGITITKHNIIAEIPILGHQYSTHQYLGSMDMEAIIVFSSVKERKLRELQGIIELSQRNARRYRSAKHSLSIEIDNPVFDLMGFKHGLFEGVTSENVQGSPGLYTVGLQLTEFNETPPRLSQERFIPAFLWKVMAKYVVENLMNVGSEQAIRYLTSKYGIATAQEGGVKTFEDPEVQYSLSKFFTDAVQRRITDSFAQRITIVSTLPGFRDIPVIKEFSFVDTNVAKLLSFYANAIGIAIENRLHPNLLRTLGFDALIPMIQQINEYINSIPLLTRILGDGIGASPSQKDHRIFNKIRNNLKGIAKDVVSGDVIYDDFFASFRSQYPQAIDTTLKGTPCYPDLDLPPHPLTGSVINTAPDFWFYNESVDGALLLPSMRKEALVGLKRYAQNMYESLSNIGDKSYYDKYYLSYNKPDISMVAGEARSGVDAIGQGIGGVARSIQKDIDKRGDRYKKAFAGSFFPGEDGLGLDTQWEVDIAKLEESAKTSNTVDRGPNDYHLTKNKIGGKPGDKVKFGQQNISGSELYKDAAEEDKTGIESGYSTRLESMLDSNFFNMDQEIYRLARAYPTFRIEFIEEDSGDKRGYRNFDDFYSYSAIKDLRVVRSRKIPADLCVVSIINDSGELDNIVYGSGDDDESSAYVVEKFNPLTVDTKQENPFSKLVLMEGSKIRIRLGYSNDPGELETVFNGQVVSVGVSDVSPDIIQIVCQSYAVELVSELKNDGAYEDTQELLSSMICQSEITHFGHWSIDQNYDPAEVRTKRDTEGAPDFFSLPAWDYLRKQTLKRYTFLNNPQDDNIFAPTREAYETNGRKIVESLNYLQIGNALEFIGILDNDRIYHPRQVTVWDIFKEMELRHPGYIASPVPYGTRMTMFFGPPNHRYWSRPMNRLEMDARNFTQLIEHRLVLKQFYLNHFTKPPATSVYFDGQVTAGDIQRYKEKVEWLEKERYKRYKPFRSYHYLSTQHNIIANNISASAHNTFNAVHLGYMDDVIEEEKIEAQNQLLGQNNSLVKAIQDNLEILECKADDNIEDKDTRVMTVTYPSCYGTFYARRYAAALLARSLRDVYKGTIYITGNPAMKPYDMCYIYDTYRDMYGPVEVEQVTHIFSRETGFITEIKPDMCVAVSDYTTQCTTDAMWQLATDIFYSMADRDNVGSQASTLVGVGLAGAGFTAAFGGVGIAIAAMGGFKIAQWTQLRQPLVITPLTLGYKPMIAGVHGYKNDQFFVSIKGRLRKWWDEVEEGWNVFWDSAVPEFATNTLQKYFTDQ